MSQITIVTTPINSGNGTPLATAFNDTNSNFTELYNRYQSTPPSSSTGKVGDEAGMYASDSTYYYYCFANYTGNSAIWAQVTQVANVSVSSIQSGNSNVKVVGPSANVTININGTSNVATFSPAGIYAGGLISASGNITGNYILGNGSALTGLPATYTNANVIALFTDFGGNVIANTGNISGSNINGTNIYSNGVVCATGNVRGGNINTAGLIFSSGNVQAQGNAIAGNVISLGYLTTANGLESTSTYPGPYTDGIVIDYISGNGRISAGSTDGIAFYNNGVANVLLASINPSGALSAVGNVSGTNLTTLGNVYSQGIVSAQGNIVTSGYFVGTFVGNVTGNFVVPGSNTQIIFNTSGNADASAGLTYNKGSNTFTVLGIVSSQGNVIGGNITTAGNVSAAGNITGANLVVSNITGVITSTSSSQPNITSLGSLVSLSVVGNVTGGNILTGNTLINNGVSTTGNITATNYTGTNVSVTGTVTAASTVGGVITGANVSVGGNVTGAWLIGYIGTASQNNITSVGTLNLLNVTSNITAGNLTVNGQVSAVGNIHAGNLTITNVNAGGNVTASGYTGISVSVTGNVTGGNILVNGYVSASGNVAGNYFVGNGSALTGTYGNSNVSLFLSTFGSNSISTTGTVTASSTVGGIITGANVSITGDINNANLSATGTIIGASLSVSGNVTNGNILTGGLISATGSIIGGNILTGGLISSTGNATFGNLSVGSGTITVGNIVSGAGNLAGTIGSSSNWFGNAYVRAVNALYADLAENYAADAEYAPGTVVVFGGTAEITTTTQFADVRVAGAISTDPAYLMNSGEPGLAVALRGRVPVQVIGPVNKGDLLVTAGANPGYAISVGTSIDYPLAVFAKSIETNTNEGVKIITAVII
jgi:hypothetical protein